MSTWFFNAEHHIDELGLISTFVDDSDATPAAIQIDGNYQHGGGWRPLKGFKLSDCFGQKLVYPVPEEDGGDEVYDLVAFTSLPLSGEIVLVYERGFTAILRADDSMEVARLD